MSPPSICKLVIVSLLSIWGLVAQVTASPLAVERQYAHNALRNRAALKVRKTTLTDTTTIDWIPIESQGHIATPPPPIIIASSAGNASRPISELQQDGAELGPPGTVPIPRVSSDYLETVATKGPPDLQSSTSKAKRQYSGTHWYVSANQNVANHGGSATYSLFDAFVNNNGDFSLLQTAVVKSSTSKGRQTIEAGWINYPNQVSAPHLFTFYTTNNYASLSNNVGGWNRDVSGWVQVDSQIFPGTVFSPTSTDGGTQYELQIKYLLYQGNWWLWVQDRWIGYYPASLFSNGVSGDSLATGSDVIYYYGEVLQSEGPITNTDMGSGEFATTGFGHSAYIHNMVYTDTSSNTQDFTAGFGDSDSSRYNHVNAVSSGTNWGSYVYLGGPGAGGVVHG